MGLHNKRYRIHEDSLLNSDYKAHFIAHKRAGTGAIGPYQPVIKKEAIIIIL